MEYLKISNQIEIEPNAFHLLGACTKRGDTTKIGYFGSGLKYAIATLLREKIEFEVYSGKKELAITYEPDQLRGQEFDVIHIDGQKTSMTTSMGPDWKLWQAIREIYCNALDEPGCAITRTDEIAPADNETAFYFRLHLNCPLQKLVAQWDKYFAHNRPPVLTNAYGKLYLPYEGKMSIYRKNIRCFGSHESSLFDYNFEEIEINESRLLSSSYQLQVQVGNMWKKYATKLMLDKLVALYNNSYSDGEARTLRDSMFECRLDWDYGCVRTFNEAWLTYFGDKLLIPYHSAGWFPDAVAQPNAVLLPRTLITMLQKHFGDKIRTCFAGFDPQTDCIFLAPDKKQAFLIAECMSFLEEVKIAITYPIIVGRFKDVNTLGQAFEEQIIISTRAFDLGKKAIVNVIIEEQMHLETMFGDKTREFQNYIINQLVTMLENQYGVFL